MSAGFFELTVVILAAAGLGVLLRFLRQPIILGYLAAGVLIGLFGFFHLDDQEIFHTFSDLGIMFLLFLVGLEINYTSVRYAGKVALFAGLGQVAFTFLFWFLLASTLGFSTISALYLSIALTLSSTVIVVKLLSERKATSSLYGKISIGILLVQDVLVIFILVVLAGIQSGDGFSPFFLGLTLIKGGALFFGSFWLGRRLLPFLFDRIARSQELLFLTSIGWAFLMAGVAQGLGLSIEIGGFLAGLSLANAVEHFQIASRIRPLRDFFILIFFVILGSSLALSGFGGLFLPIIIFSVFVLVGNPLIVFAVLGIMGYRSRTLFFTGVTIAQISEFSLVLAALGLRSGHIGQEVVTILTAVAAVTFTSSTYFILHAERLFSLFGRWVKLFERTSLNSEDGHEQEIGIKPIIMIGFHRAGQRIAEYVPKSMLMVVDFDPDMIELAKKQKICYTFGDITDTDILEKANLAQARLVVSTIPDFEGNLALLEIIQRSDHAPHAAFDAASGGVEDVGSSDRIKVIVKAEDHREAALLYRNGADYVFLPHATAGHYLGKLIAADPRVRVLEQLREKDLQLLEPDA